MTAITYSNKLTNYNNVKVDFFCIVEQMLAFVSSTNLVREVKNKSPKFKQSV